MLVGYTMRLSKAIVKDLWGQRQLQVYDLCCFMQYACGGGGAKTTVSKVKESPGATVSHPPIGFQSCYQQFVCEKFREVQAFSSFFLGMKSPNTEKITVKCICLRRSRVQDLTEGQNHNSRS